jgi:hypothetical protein
MSGGFFALFEKIYHVQPILTVFSNIGEDIQYTVTRIDGKLHQPDRMAPDQTIRAMGNNSAFTMEIFGFFQHVGIILPFQNLR